MEGTRGPLHLYLPERRNGIVVERKDDLSFPLPLTCSIKERESFPPLRSPSADPKARLRLSLSRKSWSDCSSVLLPYSGKCGKERRGGLSPSPPCNCFRIWRAYLSPASLIKELGNKEIATFTSRFFPPFPLPGMER